MNLSSYRAGIGMFAVALIAVWSARAHALGMHTVASSIHQAAFTAGISLGHTVAASTNMNHLNVGGSFEARCPSTYLYPIARTRTLPAQVLAGGVQLYVTIPEVVPTVIDMPGFENLPGGTTMTCSYNWTATAEESSYTFGFGGFTLAYGGDKKTDSGGVPFDLYKPADGDGDTRGGCMR